VLATAALGLLAIWRPGVGLAAMLCLFGFKQWCQATSPFLAEHRTLPNFAMALVLCLALLSKAFRGGGLVWKYPKAGMLTLALFAIAGLSWFWCISPFAFEFQWSLSWPYVLTLVVLAPLIATSDRELRDAFIATLTFGAVLLIPLAFTVNWSGRTIAFSASSYGAFGQRIDVGNPLAVAQMAGYVAIIGTLLNFRGIGRLWQVLRWGVVALGTFVILKSESRGQFFCVLVAICAFLPASRRPKDLLGLISITVGVIIFGFVVGILYSIYAAGYSRWSAGEMFDAVQQGRLARCADVLRYWLEHPGYWLFGYGNSGSFAPEVHGMYPEVVPVEILVEEGLFGFSIFLAILGITTRTMWKTYRLVADSPYHRGIYAVLGSLAVYEFLLLFKQGNLVGYVHFFMFAILIGRFAQSIRAQAQVPAYQVEELEAVYGQEAYASA
jgi:hypothetical protein